LAASFFCIARRHAGERAPWLQGSRCAEFSPPQWRSVNEEPRPPVGKSRAERCLGEDGNRVLRLEVPRTKGLKRIRSGGADVLQVGLKQKGCVMNSLKNFLGDESGATAIEYGLIAAGISVAIVTVVGTVGSSLQGTFTSLAAKLK
jgi:pilus assembly protein Flp/PilA